MEIFYYVPIHEPWYQAYLCFLLAGLGAVWFGTEPR